MGTHDQLNCTTAGNTENESLPCSPMADNSNNQEFSPNAQAVVELAEHLALTTNSVFIGTEHLLQALLGSPCRSLSWLERQEMSKKQVLKTLTEILATTMNSGRASFYSACLDRSLQLAAHVWQGYPIPTEGLLLGALLANKENTNALGAVLGNACGGKDLLELLLAEQPFAKDKLDNIPPKQHPAPAEGTHWVIPERLAAGKSAGDLPSSSLKALVDAGVDTFVNLQKSYREYDCSDYRETLKILARKPSFPPHPISFLHFPIPDLDVVKDQVMLALIDQLTDLLKKGRCLYVHCYGGHGRTGTVLLHLLSATLGQDMKASMKVLREAHRARGCRYFCALRHGELEDMSQQQQADRLEKVVYTRAGKIEKLKGNKNNDLRFGVLKFWAK